jgi:hypothetical protein
MSFRPTPVWFLCRYRGRTNNGSACRPLFRRYATRSLEESRGLVPPYANGCDEVLSICKVARVFANACTRRRTGVEVLCFQIANRQNLFSKSVTAIVHPPRRHVRPAFQRIFSEVLRAIRMTAGTGVRHLQGSGRRRRDDFERVSADIDVRDRLLDCRHVAAHAFISGGSL